MERTIYNEDHALFRDQYSKFVEKEIVPFYDDWEKAGGSLT